jgi:hypothetical protein
VSAQGRAVPRPGPYYRPSHYYRPYYRPYYYAPYYRPYYYGPYYPYYAPYYGLGFSFAFGWGGYPGSYYAPYPYPYGAYHYDYAGSARLQVKPRQAEVFIDGYHVGVVDNFDGWAQRLRVEPGEHTIEIFLQGHRTYRQNVLFRPGATINFEHVMQPLQPGDPAEVRPTPSPSARQRPASHNYAEPPADRAPEPRRSPPRNPSQAVVVVEPRDYGSLAIRVQPMDAQVVVDGESWQSPEAGSITLQLSEGNHRIEVRKEGFRTYSADVRVRRGETMSVNVSLSRQ